MNRVLQFVVFLALSFHVHAFGGPVAPTSSRERIAYSTFRPGNWEIYYHAGKGEKVAKKITSNPSLDYDPVLCPDGEHVVFTSERSGTPHLYIDSLSAPGEARILLRGNGMQDQAKLSPNGKLLAFVSTHEGRAGLFTIPFKCDATLDLDSATRITAQGGNFRPAFSPDGKEIAFSSDRDSKVTGVSTARERNGDIYVLKLASHNVRRITQDKGWCGSPCWSPDGKRIYGTAARRSEAAAGPGGRDIVEIRLFSVGPQGDDFRFFGKANQIYTSPAMGPDGRIWVSAREGQMGTRWQIKSIDPKTNDERLESEDNNSYWCPAFGPAGAWVCHGTSSDAPEPLLDAASPSESELPDRHIGLYAYRAFAVALSPNENKVAFTDRSGDRASGFTRLMISEANGSNPKHIFRWDNNQNPFTALNWSWDGKQIYFMRGQNFGDPTTAAHVWRVQADGSNAEDLTPNARGNNGFAAVSGDGRRFTYRGLSKGHYDIFLADFSKTDPINLTKDDAKDSFPTFSPTGKCIVYATEARNEAAGSPNAGTFDLYRINFRDNGTAEKPVPFVVSPGHDSHPHFSPDGQWVVFASERGGISDEEPLIQSILFNPQMYGEIYAARLRDGYTVRLTHNKWEDGFPCWAKAVE